MSDPADITQFACASSDKAGWTTYCDPGFTALIEEAAQAPTVAAYTELLGQANERLKKAAVFLHAGAESGEPSVDRAR